MLRAFRLACGAFALAVFAAALLPACAADDPPSNPPPRRGGGGTGGILQNDKVQSALNLTDDQKAKIKQIVEDMRSGAASLRDLSQEERRAKMQERTKQLFEKVSGVLDDKQKDRLKQIRVQIAGVAGLVEGD